MKLLRESRRPSRGAGVLADIEPRFAYVGLFDANLDAVSERRRLLFIEGDAQIDGEVHFYCRRQPLYLCVAPTATSGVVFGHSALPIPRRGRWPGVYVVTQLAEDWPTVDFGLVEDELAKADELDEAIAVGRGLGRPPST